MDTKTYYTPMLQDHNLPKGFVSQSVDHTVPISVIGNGGSLNYLTNKHIDEINETRLFRCNWAFDDPSNIKKEYAIYFAQAYKGTNENEFTHAVEYAYQQNIFKYYRFQQYVVYNFDKCCTLIDQERDVCWPTTGIQMLLTAAYLIPTSQINIAGLDMYTYKRPSRKMSKEHFIKYLKEHGKTFSRSPVNSAGTNFFKDNLTYVDTKTFVNTLKSSKYCKHYIEQDILVLLNIFLHCILSNIKIKFYGVEILEQIYNVVVQNKEIVHNYFKQKDNELDNQKSAIVKTYNIWRLINNVIDDVLID